MEAEPSKAAAPSQPEAAPAVQVPLSFQHRPGLHDSNGKLLLKNLSLPELEEWCASVGGCWCSWQEQQPSQTCMTPQCQEAPCLLPGLPTADAEPGCQHTRAASRVTAHLASMGVQSQQLK